MQHRVTPLLRTTRRVDTIHLLTTRRPVAPPIQVLFTILRAVAMQHPSITPRLRVQPIRRQRIRLRNITVLRIALRAIPHRLQVRPILLRAITIRHRQVLMQHRLEAILRHRT